MSGALRFLLILFSLIPAAFADEVVPCDPPLAVSMVPLNLLASDVARAIVFEDELARMRRENPGPRSGRSEIPLGMRQVPPALTPFQSITRGVRVRKVGNDHVVEIDSSQSGGLRLPSTLLRGRDENGVYSGEAQIEGRFRLRGSINPSGRFLIVQSGELEVWRIHLPRGVDLQAMIGHSIKITEVPSLGGSAPQGSVGPQAGFGLTTEGPQKMPLTFSLNLGTDLLPRRGEPLNAVPAASARLGFEF